MICVKNLRFSSRPRAKVRHQGPLGSARAQPCSWSSDNLQLKYLLTICCGLLLLPGILISRHQLFKRWIVLSDGEISIQGIGQLVFVWQSGTYPVELTRQRLNMFNMPNV